jgi:uncharacterized phiE125 gp8 family phage protein
MSSLGVGPQGRFSVISTVTSASASHELTTLAVVKAELNLTSVDSARDDVLARYIAEASAAIENFCNRVFVVESIKDRFYPSREVPLQTIVGGVDPIQLSRWPVTTLTSVREDGEILVEDDDFVLDAARGHVIRLDANAYPSRWGASPIVAEYAAGYGAIPADVSDAAIRTVCGRFYARGRDPMLRAENVAGVWEAQYWVAAGADDMGGANLPPGVQSLLDNYRQPVTA